LHAAGVLLAEVAIAKGTAETRRFLVIDAAMNDLVRPAMYDAYHGIVPLSAADLVGTTNIASDPPKTEADDG
jgi:diaminopimelate decarboxylase